MTLANDVKTKLGFQPGDAEAYRAAERSVRQAIIDKFGETGWRKETSTFSAIKRLRQNYLAHGTHLLKERTMVDMQLPVVLK